MIKRTAGILIGSVLLGIAAAGCMTLPEADREGREEEAELSEPEEILAWWSLTCELPNPEKLPVKVRFQWLKGLE